MKSTAKHITSTLDQLRKRLDALPASQRRVLFWAPAVLILVLVFAWLLRPQAVPVDFDRVSRGVLQVTITDEGETRVHDVFVVSAPVQGLMRRVELEAGDAVAANDTVIARIEPSVPMPLDERTEAEARAAVDAAASARSFAQANLRRVQAEYEFAESEFRRLNVLAERGSISRNELDAAERRAKTAAAAVDEAKAAIRMRTSEYEQAQARLLRPGAVPRSADECECVLVRSPTSGTVLRVVTKSESIVQPGTAIVEIGDPRTMEVWVDLLSEDAVRVEPGQRVRVEGWGGEEALEGVVRRVEPFGYTKVSALGIEEQRVNVLIDLTEPYERWNRLGHGYRVQPYIVVWEEADVLQVPLSALFRYGLEWAVFVVEDGRAVLRVVSVGQDNGLIAEIRAGLKEGEVIIVHPNERVEHNARVTMRSG